MFYNAKKIFNIDGTRDLEYSDLIESYRYRALDQCHEKLRGRVEELFDYAFRATNISSRDLQRNYLLCGFASIIGKLTRDSIDYDSDAVDSLRNLIELYAHYYFNNKLDSNVDVISLKYIMYSTAAIDNVVGMGEYDTKENIDGLYQVSKILMESKIDGVKMYNEMENKYFNDIAENPFGFDIFALGIRRHDELLNYLSSRYEHEERLYKSKKWNERVMPRQM